MKESLWRDRRFCEDKGVLLKNWQKVEQLIYYGKLKYSQFANDKI